MPPNAIDTPARTRLSVTIKTPCNEKPLRLGADKFCRFALKRIEHESRFIGQLQTRLRTPSRDLLFRCISALAVEEVYLLGLPFTNVVLGRQLGFHVLAVWFISFFIGHSLKDFFRLPRPYSPPVFRVESSYAAEYGLPSTHVMVSLALALTFSHFLFSLNMVAAWLAPWCLLCALVICSGITFSRVYLGAHSLLDVTAGVVLAVLVSSGWAAVGDDIEGFFRTCGAHTTLCVLAVLCVVCAYLYPQGGSFRQKRDTFKILMVFVGTVIGHNANAHLPDYLGPASSLWPGLVRWLVTMVVLVVSVEGSMWIFGKVFASRMHRGPYVRRVSQQQQQQQQEQQQSAEHSSEDETHGAASKFDKYALLNAEQRMYVLVQNSLGYILAGLSTNAYGPWLLAYLGL